MPWNQLGAFKLVLGTTVCPAASDQPIDSMLPKELGLGRKWACRLLVDLDVCQGVENIRTGCLLCTHSPVKGKRAVSQLAGLWGLSLVARPRTEWEDGTVQVPLTLLCWNWT